MSFFFFFSFLFCPVLERPLFPTCRVLKPPPLHHASPLKPRKSRRCHCLIPGHVSKYMFFFFFFRFFFDQCYRDPLYPTRRVLNPPASPPHNPYPHIPPLKPRKSPPPRRTQVVTSASPLRHAQVRCHHPVTVRKTRRDTAPTPSQHGVQARLRRQPAPRK